jgi:hypothetical protein
MGRGRLKLIIYLKLTKLNIQLITIIINKIKKKRVK